MRAPQNLSTAVLDANGIIGLAKGACFSLVPHVFSDVYVPSLVVKEITDPISKGEVDRALRTWLKEASATAASLHRVFFLNCEADQQVIALALDHTPCVIVTGDWRLVNKATQLQIPTISSPRLIQLFAEVKLISAAKPQLDLMRDRSFGIPQELYREILTALGEE